MSKICSVCGAQADDIAFVCGNCGSPLYQSADATAQPQVQPAAPVQPQTQPAYAQPDYQQYYQQPVQQPQVQQEAPAQPDYQQYYQQPVQQPKAAPKTKKKVNIDVNAIFATVTGKIKEIISGVKKGDKKSIITVGGVAAAVLAVLIIIISIASVPGEEKVAKKLMKAIEKDKAESIVKLLPKFYLGETTYGLEMDEIYWEEFHDGKIDSFRNWVGDEVNASNFKIKWDVSDVDEFGPEYMEELSEEFGYYSDFKENKLKKGALIEIEAECKKGSDKYNIEIEAIAYKYGGSWYLFSWETDSSVAN